LKKFYLLRLEDVHSTSGTGVVAEGVIFGDGTGSYTGLTKHKTVTTFVKVKDVMDLHGHGGRTLMIIEGIKKDSKRFEECDILAHDKWLSMKSVKKAKEEV
jgi:hypothetical protein